MGSCLIMFNNDLIMTEARSKRRFLVRKPGACAGVGYSRLAFLSGATERHSGMLKNNLLTKFGATNVNIYVARC